MKKYLFTVFLFAIGFQVLRAQRLIKGQKGFEVSAGLISDKKPLHEYFYVQAAMIVNEKKGNYQFWGLEYSRKKHEYENYAIPVESYFAEGGYSFFLLGDRAKNISLNFGISGIAGYEVINQGESGLSNGAVIQNGDHFIYGGGLRLSLETYLGDHLVLLLQGRVKAVWGTSVEHLRPSAGVGIRYIF